MPDPGRPDRVDRSSEASPVGVSTTADPELSDDRAPGSGPGWASPFRIGIVVVGVAAALLAWSLSGDAATAYRTAEVGTGTVEATLDSVGTINPINQANLDFNASGTVAAVDVSVGQQVTAGQTIASLDLATLDAAVTTAKASLASAQATLAAAEASQTASSTSTASTTPTTLPSTSSTSTSQKVASLQAALVAAQNQADTDSTAASAALTSATTLCATPAAGTDTTTPTSSPPTTTTTVPAASPAFSGTGGAGGATPGTGTTPTSGGPGTTTTTSPTTCAQALSQASTAQSQVSTDLKQVSGAESDLTAALESSTGQSQGSGQSPSATTGSATTGSASTGSASTGSAGARTSGGSTKPATAQQLAVDQASIDTAQANVDQATQAVGGANLVSTVAGTVAAVSIAVGDPVTAGGSSASPEVVVIGSGSAYQVATTVSVADIGQVAVGQPVEVVPDSTDTTVTGHVSSIGVLASSGSTTTTYPVTVTLDAADLGGLSGAGADVSIVVKRSVGVTTVPSSAVHTIGSIHLVDVVHGGTVKPTPVTVGTVGSTLTQLTSGVNPGQRVSLADLNAPLPSTSTTATRFGGAAAGLGGLGGGFGGTGGAGFGGGGFGRTGLGG